MKYRFLFLLAFIAILFGCSEDILLNDFAKSAEEDALKSEKNIVARPFKIKGSGTIAFVEPAECPGLAQLFAEGTGKASHLGLFTVELTICSNFDFEHPENLIYEINGTQTAANGDKLYFSSSYENGDINFVDGSTLYHYKNGTGRFEDVEGEITLYGVADIPGGVYSNYGEGWIRY